jgi:DNA-binding CsgD family transcriptional regulator
VSTEPPDIPARLTTREARILRLIRDDQGDLSQREAEIMRLMREGDDPEAESAQKRFWRLSRRELEVVTLLLDGLRVPLIARTLWITQSTVRNHLTSAYQKLGVSSQQELILWCMEHRLPKR